MFALLQPYQAERQQAAQIGPTLGGCHLVGRLAVRAGSFSMHRVFHEENATRLSTKNNAVQMLMGRLRKHAWSIGFRGNAPVAENVLTASKGDLGNVYCLRICFNDTVMRKREPR